MCTGLILESKNGNYFFGRNMDIEFSFNQSIIFLPRNYEGINTETGRKVTPKYAVLGMGTIFNEYPTFADGFNEKGLGVAGLNFPGYAYYPKERSIGKENIPQYDFTLWILANFSSVEEVKEVLKNTILVDERISKNVPNSTLHWIIGDSTGKSIVVEQSKDGLKVFDNNVGVLTNSPTFDWHMTNLRQYLSMNYNQITSLQVGNEDLTALGQGTGLVGLPGDFTPASRFIRVALLRDAMMKNAKDSINIMEFFHILNNVAMISGSVVTPAGKNDLTQYTACMDLEEGVYYYNTYENNQVNAIGMKKENLDGKEMKVYKYNTTLNINYEN
ncbi:choloylglycine hydrolase [Clostridium sp. B9]|uniref:choloylglycine hydrolase n=1 Tax=Clostridium sp. B9 TaxID=3423224 RepID=UPI003D2F187C